MDMLSKFFCAIYRIKDIKIPGDEIRFYELSDAKII